MNVFPNTEKSAQSLTQVKRSKAILGLSISEKTDSLIAMNKILYNIKKARLSAPKPRGNQSIGIDAFL